QPPPGSDRPGAGSVTNRATDGASGTTSQCRQCRQCGSDGIGLLNLRKHGLKVIRQSRRSTQFENAPGRRAILMTARRRVLQTTLAVLIGAALGGGQRAALAGEEDDLQREIDTQRVSVADLERLDELKATGDEIP